MKKSQAQILEDHLKTGKIVTAMDVIRICNTTSPTKRISEVRAKHGDSLKQRKVKTATGKLINMYYLESSRG